MDIEWINLDSASCPSVRRFALRARSVRGCSRRDGAMPGPAAARGLDRLAKARAGELEDELTTGNVGLERSRGTYARDGLRVDTREGVTFLCYYFPTCAGRQVPWTRVTGVRFLRTTNLFNSKTWGGTLGGVWWHWQDGVPATRWREFKGVPALLFDTTDGWTAGTTPPEEDFAHILRIVADAGIPVHTDELYPEEADRLLGPSNLLRT